MDKIRMEAAPIQFITIINIEDFDLLLTIAIGSRHLLHDEISKLYKKNRETYYQFFKASSYASDRRLSSLSVENYKAIQQFIGIYLYEKQSDSNQITMRLIRKGYRFVYQFIKNNFQVDFYKLRDEYIEYVKKNSLEKNVHLGQLFGIALYLCKELNKTIIFDSFDIKLLKEAIQQVFTPIEIIPDTFTEVDDFLENYKETGLLKKDFSLPLKDLVVAFNRFHQEQALSNKDDFIKGLNKVGLMLQYCNINPLDIQNITTMEDGKLKEIVALAMSAIEMFQLSEETDSLLGTYLLIYALAQDYNLTKYNLMVTTEEETYLELKELKKEYEKKLKKVQKEEGLKIQKMEQLKNFNEKLHEKVRDLEKKLTEKEKLLQKQQLELQKQKDAYHVLHQKYKIVTEKTDEIRTEEIIDFLQGKNCVIIGGLRSWQEQIKTVLPNIRFIQPEELHIDLTFLQNADIVMFNESINNHAMYFKVKKTVESNGTPICYSGSNTNIHISLRKLYDKLNESIRSNK